MKCEIIHNLLPLYDDGGLSLTEQITVRDHLLGCSSCQAKLKQFRDMTSSLHLLKENYYDQQKVNSILQQVNKDKKVSRLFPWMRRLLWQPIPFGGVLTTTLLLVIVFVMNLNPKVPVPTEVSPDLQAPSNQSEIMSFNAPAENLRALSGMGINNHNAPLYSEIKTSDLHGFKEKIIVELGHHSAELTNESIVDKDTILLFFAVPFSQRESVIQLLHELGFSVITAPFSPENEVVPSVIRLELLT